MCIKASRGIRYALIAAGAVLAMAGLRDGTAPVAADGPTTSFSVDLDPATAGIQATRTVPLDAPFSVDAWLDATDVTLGLIQVDVELVYDDFKVSAPASGIPGDWLDTPLARGYQGGTELSGGQWQRVALARALLSVRLGAGLVLLDEPTAQLDVRGEAEVFDRILAATRKATTILISHRFSTVRHADRICVLEHGRVVELGTHEELMSARGRYRTMFELQAKRFGATEDEEGTAYDRLA